MYTCILYLLFRRLNILYCENDAHSLLPKELLVSPVKPNVFSLLAVYFSTYLQ